MNSCLLFLTLVVHYCTCRDFYVGMFKKNDFLVAQDNLYQEKIPYRVSYAKYGRLFKCPITYIRVVDRLGIGRGPRVQITRGGLRKKYVVLRLASPYNNPISVNIYIGCENKMKKPKFTRKLSTTAEADITTCTTDSASTEPTKTTTDSPIVKLRMIQTRRQTSTLTADPPILKLLMVQTRHRTTTTRKTQEPTTKLEATTVTEESTTVTEEPTTVSETSTTVTEESTPVTQEPTTVTEGATLPTKATKRTIKRALPKDEHNNSNF